MRKNKNKFFGKFFSRWLCAALFAFLNFANFAVAAEDSKTRAKSIDLDFIHHSSAYSLKDVAFKIMKFLNLTIASAAALATVIGGLMLITAAGNDSQIQNGKNTIKYSVLGLVITLSAYLIVTLLQTALYNYGT